MAARVSDRYQLEEEVGCGGMAVVYRGLDRTLDREVAVKVMHRHLAGREESRRRFSREARAVARLKHRNIVEIYDFSGDEAEESFIVTEFVRGRTLRAFGDEVGCGLPEIAAMLILELTEALEHAHEAGVVHRDLKPENVMVREDGVLKLMDFGIARMIGKDERMTMTGALVGSPLHMAPEVIEGREAGESADVFALGTIFYWLVTGRMAFEGNNTTQTLRQILEGQYEDPRLAAPSCSDELAAAIARCLDREPSARWASMSELRRGLAGILAAEGLERPAEELKAFFAGPAAYREGLRRRLVERLVSEGESLLAAKRTAKALALFNRVLALDEGNETVLAQLAAMRRQQALRRRLKRAGIGLGGVALVAASGWAAAAWVQTDENIDVKVVAAGGAPAAPAAPIAPARPPEPAVTPPGRPAPAPVGAAAAAGSPAPAAGGRVVPAAHKPVAQREVQLRWVPQGATLYIDGTKVDTVAPAWSGALPVGRHTVSLRHPGCCEPFEEELLLAEGQEPLQRSVALAPKESGWFEVDCDRADAEVWFDGTFKGTVADVNGRGGVPVPFSKDGTGRERYLRTVRFQVHPPRGLEGLAVATAEVTVRAGQTVRSPTVRLVEEDP